jgi:hypothetical protein
LIDMGAWNSIQMKLVVGLLRHQGNNARPSTQLLPRYNDNFTSKYAADFAQVPEYAHLFTTRSSPKVRASRVVVRLVHGAPAARRPTI